MENLVIVTPSFWPNKNAFVTGHTGFKGSWLSLWLNHMGATVHGFSLDPPSEPSLYDVADITSKIAEDVRADLADLEALKTALKSSQPDVVFHMAAQAIVRESYVSPLSTFATNVMGTANLLEAIREVESVQAVVIVTTDKVYANAGNEITFDEDAPLGGHDPYSASKAATEIITSSYRASFYGADGGHQARIATARAGNVIGGGDWAADRLVPDCLQSFTNGEAVLLRYPNAVRPWQHVLEPLSGYLKLAEGLLSISGAKFAKAWNFGPNESDDATVHDVADKMARLWSPDATVAVESLNDHPHEAGLLKLNSARARNELGWSPRWNLDEALSHTVGWHRNWIDGSDMQSVCLSQIKAYASI